MRARSFARVMVLALVVAAGCSSKNGGGGGDDDDDSGSVDCTSTQQCPSGEVCNPGTGECTADAVPCTGHADCSPASFCNASGACEPNSTGGPCEEDRQCIAGESCTGGFCGCAGVQFTAEAVPPNVMIVLDQSGSMDDEIGSPGERKWDIAVNALERLLADFEDRVRFGLVLYPSDGDCGAGEVEVAIAETNAMEIMDTLEPIEPDGSTPIGVTMDAMVGLPALMDPTRSNFVLLLTDGDERCEDEPGFVPGEEGAAALLAQSPPVKTFVVGFGGGVDEDELNDIAEAGGTALPGATKYYQADDADSLEAAFADIGGSVLSCTYVLSSQPPNADTLFVYFDGVEVPQDLSQTNGWIYDPATGQITFFGAACDALQAGQVADLVIVHGCPVDIG